MEKLEIHEFAELIPAMTADDYAMLKADIGEHGVAQAIVLFDGKILDGRHRYRAAGETGKECPSEVFKGTRDEALDRVVSLNVNRRHLNESQRALIAAEIATMRQGGDRKSSQYEKIKGSIDPLIPATGAAKPRTTTVAAKQLNVSPKSVKRAKALKREASPEVIAEVRAGKKSVSGALQEVRAAKAAAPVPVVAAPAPDAAPAKEPKELEKIALDHGLPVDTFSSKDQKRLSIWISNRGIADFEKAAQFQKATMQGILAECVAENIAPAPDTAVKAPVARRLTDIGLTREQVDPDFTGSPLDFVRQYGQVNLRTKAEIDAERAARRGEAVANALRAFVEAAPGEIADGDVLAWIAEGNKIGGKRDEKFIERLTGFRSAMARMDTMLVQMESLLTKKPVAIKA